MSYASYTYETREPIKRMLHTRRFAQTVTRIAPPNADDMILDYGCGDGNLLKLLIGRWPPAQLHAYDPDPALLAEMAPAVRAGIEVHDLAALLAERRGAFSLIYCIEVCEHLPPAALAAALGNLKALAAAQARIVIGVPIETGLPGFLKALYRTARGFKEVGIAKAFRALLARPIERMPSTPDWYGLHTGFDHARFREQLVAAGFRIERAAYEPFAAAGAALNNEVYYTCRAG